MMLRQDCASCKACLTAKESRIPADWAALPGSHMMLNYIARFSGSGATSTFTPKASNALTCAVLMPLSVIR